MKVNTDGVLLGALAGFPAVKNILDIGTGTGVIALMLAQRFPEAQIEAVEIDPSAAETAEQNFLGSPFSARLKLVRGSFQEYSPAIRSYDLIVSNPPFFLKSLKNPDLQKRVARHASGEFFKELVDFAVKYLSTDGEFWLVLPGEAALETIKLAAEAGLFLKKNISVKSFEGDKAHRQVLCFGFKHESAASETLVIYAEQKIYTNEYKHLLRDFLTIF